MSSQDLPTSSYPIRPATIEDVPVIAAIINHYVMHSTSTYQLNPDTPEQMLTWFKSHDTAHPVFVAELPPGSAAAKRIVGWGALSTFRSREGYRATVENSVYVHPEFQRRGIGSAMLNELIRQAAILGHHAIVAVIDAEQSASISLHARLGFIRVGQMPEVGRKFDRWLSTNYMLKLLK